MKKLATIFLILLSTIKINAQVLSQDQWVGQRQLIKEVPEFNTAEYVLVEQEFLGYTLVSKIHKDSLGISGGDTTINDFVLVPTNDSLQIQTSEGNFTAPLPIVIDNNDTIQSFVLNATNDSLVITASNGIFTAPLPIYTDNNDTIQSFVLVPTNDSLSIVTSNGTFVAPLPIYTDNNDTIQDFYLIGGGDSLIIQTSNGTFTAPLPQIAGRDTAQNGLTTLNDSIFELGGTLLHPTIIEGDSNLFEINNVEVFNVQSVNGVEVVVTEDFGQISLETQGENGHININSAGDYNVGVQDQWNLEVGGDAMLSSAGGFDFLTDNSPFQVNTGVSGDISLLSQSIRLEGEDIDINSFGTFTIEIPSAMNVGDVLTLTNATTKEVEFTTIPVLPTTTIAGEVLVSNGSEFIVAEEYTETHTGITGSIVPMTNTPLSYTITDVYRNGLLQELGVDYNFVFGTVVYLSVALTTNETTTIKGKK